MKSKFLRSSFLFIFVCSFVILAPLAQAAIVPVTGSLVVDSLQVPQALSTIPSPVVELSIPGISSFPVVQQPGNQAGYVSNSPDVVTQFSAASQFNSLGFLAHNYLAGGKFFSAKVGDKIILTHKDMGKQIFIIKEIRSFQATQPTSPYSGFIDLNSGNKLTYKELFAQTYGVAGQLVLQTCIEANGNDSWGRLFIIAVPYVPEIQ